MRSAPLGEGSLPRPLGTAAGMPSVLHRSDRCLRQRRRVRLLTLVLEERGLASPPGSVHTRGGLWGRSTQRKTAGWWPPGRHCPTLTLTACTGALGGAGHTGRPRGEGCGEPASRLQGHGPVGQPPSGSDLARPSELLPQPERSLLSPLCVSQLLTKFNENSPSIPLFFEHPRFLHL